MRTIHLVGHGWKGNFFICCVAASCQSDENVGNVMVVCGDTGIWSWSPLIPLLVGLFPDILPLHELLGLHELLETYTWNTGIRTLVLQLLRMIRHERGYEGGVQPALHRKLCWCRFHRSGRGWSLRQEGCATNYERVRW